jgi:hypothetical protein
MITLDEFYAFTDTRADEEHWELIDGHLVLNERPWMIPGKRDQRALGVLPGFGVRVSSTDRQTSSSFRMAMVGCESVTAATSL